MAAAMSIEEELLDVINHREYCLYVDLFAQNNPMTTKDLRDFRKRTNNRYLVETNRFYSRKGKTIPEGIYGLFGEFCESNADETRE